MRLDQTSRASILAFITAFTTLFTQVLIHRIVSAKLLNNYAFIIISLTMLGFALSGTILTGWIKKFIELRDDVVMACAAIFAISLLAVTAVFYRVDAGSQFVYSGYGTFDFLRWVPLSLLYAIPFVFCGLILGVLLSSPDLRTGRIYFFDLIGSSLGAFLVIPSISAVGVEYSLLIVSGLFVTVTAIIAKCARKLPVYAISALSLIAILIAATFPGTAFLMRYPEGSMLDDCQKLGPGYGIEYVAWDPLSRIEVSRIKPPAVDKTAYPLLIGGNLSFHAHIKRMITQNNFAFTYAVDYDGSKDSLKGIEETIYASAYQATSISHPRIAIVGVGGGIDVLTALYFDPGSVTAVEINKATIGILTRKYADYFQHWVNDPRVILINDEGRHYLSTTDQSFDIIQLSGVDSYSGTPGLAHVFSENYLYTAEAFDLYFSRLSKDGILCMMRLEHKPPREMLRALTTAVATLRKAGISHPAHHIVTLTAQDGKFTAMLMKKAPFSDEEIERLKGWTGKNPLFILSAAPGLNIGRNTYQHFLMLDSPESESVFLDNYVYDIRPTDDNRPFFFKFSYWWHLLIDPQMKRLISPPLMEYVIITQVTVVGTVALVCVLFPLLFLARRGLNAPHKWRFGLLFAAVGVGYMVVEIAFMQKFGLFLGHPNYSLSVVLAVVLFSSGLGSLWSDKIVDAIGGLKWVSYIFVCLMLIDYMLLPALARLTSMPFSVKVLLVSGMIFPVGFCMGMFVPAALEKLKSAAYGFVPWAWGINGVFSVVAPIIGIAISMTWGINMLLIFAIPIYLIAGFSYPKTIK
jgi:spermidine synthase